MKKIYNAFLALAAFVAFGAVASAQEVPYYVNAEYGIGYNKTIVTDPVTGDHRIRLETFATGGGERKAIPSDIVLVLDNSGSMLYSYVLDKSKYKKTLTQEEVDAPVADGKDPLLIEETQFYLKSYAYNYVSNKSNVGETNTITWSSAFDTEARSGDGTYTNKYCARYAKYEGKYHRVFHFSETRDGATWYYLCFRDDNNNLVYLDGDSFVTTKPTSDRFKTSDQTVLFKGSSAKGTLLYRSKTRMEKLLESVHLFVQEIYDNNQVIAGDLDGKVGNQIGIVAFGSNSDSAPTNTSPTSNCQIIKALTPVSTPEDTVAILNSLNIMNFTGGTAIGRGMRLASEVFDNLRSQGDEYDAYEMENGAYKHDSANQPIVNRSKIAVVFTDGEPTSEGAYTPYSGSSANSARARAIGFSNIIKKTGEGYTNGKIFSVALNPKDVDKDFLQHVSSNYDQSTISGSTPTFTPASTTKDLYYFDAGTKDLKEVFQTIASVAGGSSSANNTSIVNLDIVSKSFRIDKQDGVDLEDNIKVYTAQCLGLDPDKTYEENGVTKHYLAFADSIAAGARPAVPVLWTSQTDEETGVVSWTEENNVDVDGSITVTVEDDGTGQSDVIKVSGFDYGKLWCGLDGVTGHNNSEQYNAADYGDFNIGTGPYIQGYRGFKLIIEIPIALKDNAIGGPKVKTNEPGSGLYDPANDKLLVSFPSPAITIPVNLWIRKEGLKKGESASLTIERKLAKPTTEVPDPQYEFFTNVLVTGKTAADGSSEPVTVKLLNLDAAYYYRILEDGWTWSYTNPAQEEGTAPNTENLTENPIVIVNTPKPGNLPKHAESVANNQMGTAAGVGGSTTTVSTREHTTVTTP